MQEIFGSTVPWHPDSDRIMNALTQAKELVIANSGDCLTYESGCDILRGMQGDPVYNEDPAFGFHWANALRTMQSIHKPDCPDFFGRHTLYYG